MRTNALLLLGVCCGALGAFVVLSHGSNAPVRADGDRSAVAAGGSGAPIGARGAAGDALDAGGRLAAPESLEARAAVAPRAAFHDALALEHEGSKRIALLRVARIWVRVAPEDALAQAADLRGEMRYRFQSAVAEEWAFVDPAAFFAYAETVASIEPIAAGLRVLLATDPERVWQIVDRHFGLGESSIDELYLSAVRAMTSRDPSGTMARLRPAAVGQRRDPILTSIAEAYASIDVDAALAWVMSLEPPSPEGESAVIARIAAEDLLRAYELVRRDAGTSLSVDSVRSLLVESAVEGGQEPAAMATALVQRGEPESAGSLLSALLNRWVRDAPTDAMEWLGANRANVTADTVSSMVTNLAYEDVRLAASLAGAVPPDFQYRWLESVALRYGQFDVREGMDWITAYRSRNDYNELLAQVLNGAIYGDPEFVTDFIATSSLTFEDNLIGVAAEALAEQDPQAAAEWAGRLANAEQSAVAIEGVVRGWLDSDPAAVQQWVLQQPRNASRDRILDALMTVTGFSPSGLDYAALAAGYTSNAAAQQTMAEYVELAVRFPVSSPYREAAISQADQMLELLTDPELRRQAEERLSAVR